MDSVQRNEKLQSIANKIADYRQGEIAVPTPDHVDRWVKQFRQFNPDYEAVILQEMDHVLEKYYISKERAHEYIKGLLKSKRHFGSDPKTVLKDTLFLNIQRKGSSQKDLLLLAKEILKTEYNLNIKDCGTSPKIYVYLDDCLFTGNTAVHDIRKWATQAIKGTQLQIFFFVSHKNGWEYLKNENGAYDQLKDITVTYRSIKELKDATKLSVKTECLWPVELVGDTKVDLYINAVKQRCHGKNFSPRLFRPKSKMIMQETIFTSSRNRETIEQAFLQAGALIASLPRTPKPEIRPLGYEYFESLGFGAFVVTYRNCSNNCPLALWWGDTTMPASHPFSKWYPLFPRRVNEASSGSGDDFLMEF